MADHYLDELLDIGPPTQPIYAWPTDKDQDDPVGFCADAKGEVLVYDNGWRPVASTTNSDRKSTANQQSPGILSPDGRLQARLGKTGLEIWEFQTQKILKTIKVPGGIESLKWSPDSHRIAVVITKHRKGSDEIFDHDEIAVYGL